MEVPPPRGSTPQTAKWTPPKSMFWMVQLRVPVCYDISRYLTDKYFDIVWGCHHPPGDPPKWTPKKSIFWMAQARVPVFYDISRYLTDKYFDIVWGCHAPRGLPQIAEVESSRTSLASRTSSRTDFEVLGLGLEGQVLGLEASSPRKLACPRLKDNTNFWNVKILWSARKIFWKTFFSGDRLKNFCEDLFFFFLESTCALCPWSLALASSIPVLGLESVCPRKGCPWPRIFFVSLALASSLVFSTPPLPSKPPIINFFERLNLGS